MRVLLLTQYYPPETGAAPVRLQAMVRELVRRGHTVSIVTALPNYPAGRIYPGYRRRLWVTERRDGATVRRVWIHAATGSGLGRALGFVTFALNAAVAMFTTRRPDLVLVETPPLPATIPALVHRLARRRSRIVLLLADLWPDTAIELGLLSPDGTMARLLSRLEAYVYRVSWRISPVTEGQVEALTTRKDVAPERIAFLPNGVDTALFATADTPPDRRSPVILFAGTLGYAQGLDVVLDAVPLVRRAHGDVVFRFVGGGSDKDRLERRVAAERIDGVEFHDPVPVEEIAPMLRDAFAGITSLRSSPVLEGARPSKIFPIMSVGRPVVYSGAGEGARLVIDAGAGVVCAPEDPHSLADAIISLLDGPEVADEMGRRGRAFVEANLSWSRLVSAWLARLEEA